MTAQIPEPTMAMAVPKYHQLTPARNITTAPPNANSRAVPRSGCFRTSIIGRMIITNGGIIHSG